MRFYCVELSFDNVYFTLELGNLLELAVLLEYMISLLTLKFVGRDLNTCVFIKF